MREILYKTKYKENTILSKVYQIGSIWKCFIMGFYLTVKFLVFI